MVGISETMQKDKIITSVIKISKARYKIAIDGQFRFVLYKGELHAYHIQEGERISEEALEEILAKVLPKRAKLRSMNLLKSHAYTEYQIREKLRQGFYPERAIDEAIEYLKSFGYINDRRYVKDYILYYSESRSRGRIEQDLFRKGISKDMIHSVYAEDLGEEKLPDEISLMEKLLLKKHYDKENADYQEKQKMGAFLYRKGFSLGNIEKMLSMY